MKNLETVQVLIQDGKSYCSFRDHSGELHQAIIENSFFTIIINQLKKEIKAAVNERNNLCETQTRRAAS